jgi:ABC-type maltose transport system permease subunit
VELDRISGNTLWDWLQLLLLPLVVPAILLPALLNWITGDAAERAATARQPALKEGKDQ